MAAAQGDRRLPVAVAQSWNIWVAENGHPPDQPRSHGCLQRCKCVRNPLGIRVGGTRLGFSVANRSRLVDDHSNDDPPVLRTLNHQRLPVRNRHSHRRGSPSERREPLLTLIVPVPIAVSGWHRLNRQAAIATMNRNGHDRWRGAGIPGP